MPILFKSNPLPTTGALYVTNPRRKTIKRRTNSPMNRFIYGAVFGKIPSRLTKNQKKEIVDIREGRGGTSAQQKKAAKAYKQYKSGTGSAKTFKSADLKKKGSFAKAVKKGEISYLKGSSPKSKAKARKTTSKSRLSELQKMEAMKIYARKTVTSQVSFVTAAKKNKELKDLTVDQLTKQFKRLKKSNPMKRRNAMAIAMRNNPKRKTSKKTGAWKGRMIEYKTFSRRLVGCGLTKKQKSALWKKYKSTGKLPALAKAKKAKSIAKSRVAAVKKVAKKSKTSAKTRAGQTLRKLGYKGKLGKSLDTLAKRQKKIKELKAKKTAPKKTASKKRKTTSDWQKLVKKHGVMKAAKLHKKTASSKKRKTAASKKTRRSTPKSTYAIYMKLRKQSRGGATSGYAHELAKKDYATDKLAIEKLIAKGKTKLQAVRQIIEKKHGLLQRDRRYKVGGRQGRKTLGAGVRSTRGKYKAGAFTRLNPMGHMGMDAYYGAAGAADALIAFKPFAAVGSLLDGLRDVVSDLPVVDRLSPYVRPAGMLAVTAATLGATRHYIAPEVMKYLPMLGRYQAASGTILGGLAFLAIAAGNKVGLMQSSDATKVGGMAVAIGMAMDMYDLATKRGYVPNYLRSNAPVAGIAFSGYGDGGQYYVAPVNHIRREVPMAGNHDYSAIVAPLSGTAGTPGAPMGLGALMYTGSGY